MSKKPVGCLAEAEQEAMLALLSPAEAAIFRKALAANAVNTEADAAKAAAREKLFALLSPEQAENTRKILDGTGNRKVQSSAGDTRGLRKILNDKNSTQYKIYELLIKGCTRQEYDKLRATTDYIRFFSSPDNTRRFKFTSMTDGLIQMVEI